MAAVGTATDMRINTPAMRSNRRRMCGSELWREVDVEARAGSGSGDRLRYIDAQCHDRQPQAEAYSHRILQWGAAEAVEGVAVIEEGGDAEVARQIPDNLDRARNDV